MPPDQLDLFDIPITVESNVEQPTVKPTAEIIPFPSGSLVGKHRRAAEVLSRMKTEPQRAAYWRNIVGDMERRLVRLGIDEQDVAAELQEFHEGVAAELTVIGRRA